MSSPAKKDSVPIEKIELLVPKFKPTTFTMNIKNDGLGNSRNHMQNKTDSNSVFNQSAFKMYTSTRDNTTMLSSNTTPNQSKIQQANVSVYSVRIDKTKV